MRHADVPCECRLIGVNRKWLADRLNARMTHSGHAHCNSSSANEEVTNIVLRDAVAFGRHTPEMKPGGGMALVRRGGDCAPEFHGLATLLLVMLITSKPS